MLILSAAEVCHCQVEQSGGNRYNRKPLRSQSLNFFVWPLTEVQPMIDHHDHYASCSIFITKKEKLLEVTRLATYFSEVVLVGKPKPSLPLPISNFPSYGPTDDSTAFPSNSGTGPPRNRSSAGSAWNQGPPIGGYQTSNWRRASDLSGSFVTASSSNAFVETRETSHIERCSLFGTMLHLDWKRPRWSWILHFLQVHTASRQLRERGKFQC